MDHLDYQQIHNLPPLSHHTICHYLHWVSKLKRCKGCLYVSCKCMLNMPIHFLIFKFYVRGLIWYLYWNYSLTVTDCVYYPGRVALCICYILLCSSEVLTLSGEFQVFGKCWELPLQFYDKSIGARLLYLFLFVRPSGKHEKVNWSKKKRFQSSNSNQEKITSYINYKIEKKYDVKRNGQNMSSCTKHQIPI